MCDLCVKRLDRPLDCQGEEEVSALAALCTRFSYQENRIEGTIQDWLVDTQEAVPLVYGGIESGEAPSIDYEAIGQQICMQQVALSGYRLAHLLNKRFFI